MPAPYRATGALHRGLPGRKGSSCLGSLTASAGKTLPPAPRPPQRRRNEPPCDARLPLVRVTGVDLRASEGMTEPPALVRRAEIGTDLKRWPTQKPLAAGLGVGPLPQIAGGTGLSPQVRRSLWGAREGGVRARLPGARRDTAGAHGSGVGLSVAPHE